MENFRSEQEKNPSARLMSTHEMSQVFNVLASLKNEGEGDKTVNELYEQINLRLGKRGGRTVESSSSDDEQDS